MSQHNQLTTHKKKQDKERRNKALDLRTQGHTVQAIANQLGISKAQASKDINRAIKENQPRPALENIILQCLATQTYRAALTPKIEQGNTSAVLAAVKCLEHEAKLLNLLSPTEIHVTGTADFATTATHLIEQITRNQHAITTADQPQLP